MSVQTITPEQLYEKLNREEKVVLVDVRSEEKYDQFHIQHANLTDMNISKQKVFELEINPQQTISEIPVDKEVIITCTTGNSATKCAGILKDRAYDVVVLEGGITAWKEFLIKQSEESS
ncbi:rhodanese-like domain-containing protein [Sporosarcina sp. CAU 1771]